MNLLTYFYRTSWPILLATAVCALVSGLSGAALVAVIGQAVAGKGDIGMLGGLFFGLFLLQLATRAASEIALLHTSQSAVAHLRVDLGRKLLALPLKKEQQLGKPALLAILTGDIDTFIMAYQLLPGVMANLVVVVTCLGYMAWLSWKLFVMVTLCMAVCVTVFRLGERVPMRHLEIVREQTDRLYGHFRGLVEGSKELKLNARRGRVFVDQVLTPSTLRFKESNVRAMSAFSWLVNFGTSAFYLVIGAVLFLIPRFYPQSTDTMLQSIFVLLYLIRPISELMSFGPTVARGSIALGKIAQLEGELDATEDAGDGVDPFASTAPLRLELQGVCHQYPGATEDTQFMLGPIDLTVHQGETVFIVGGNGSGKTTLAMLLLGLYEPEAGRLVLNGQPVTPNNIGAYRQHCSAVFADFHLFEQLMMSDEAELSRRAAHYVDKLGMSHKVKVVDGRFSTTNLSTGQRKRLALVSAYLEDRPIYLFDEWASDQDPAFKHVFYTELLPELKARGKTVLCITHDDSYFGYADRVIKVQDGHLQPMAGQEYAALRRVANAV